MVPLKPRFKFQSAPGAKAGGNRLLCALVRVGVEFQSAPGAKAGGNHLWPRRRSRAICFNPPPARRPGGTGPLDALQRPPPVSIRPRREGRGERRIDRSVRPGPGFQSAPGAKAGGNPGRLDHPALRCGFNPPPARRPGGTPAPLDLAGLPVLFKSAPGAKAGGNAIAWSNSCAKAPFQSAPGAKAGGNDRMGNSVGPG